MSRLFVAVLPPPPVLDLVAALPRPGEPGVRYTERRQWHITLRFLGEADAAEAGAALPTVAPAEVRLGPEVVKLGRNVAVIPAAGLDAMAGAVTEATAEIGRPPEDRPYRGHLTVARLKSRRRPAVVGSELVATFAAAEIHLVESRLHPDGARYRTVAIRPCSAGG